MQQAAASLMLFDGENTDGANPKMSQLTKELTVSTGHPAWMPDRDVGNLIYNAEGSVFRNKARLFSMFYICVPPNLLENNGYDKQIMLTEFGKALARGNISEKEYYRYIVKKFQYPHLAYSDYDKWKASGIIIRPFICIIKTMVYLFEQADASQAYLTSTEIYLYLQQLTNEDCQKVTSLIIKKRQDGNAPILSSDKTRKIREMLAFLAIAGYVYIDSTDSIETKYRLNLIMRHPTEKTLFYLERSAGGAGTRTKKTKINIIDQYKSLWKEE